MEDQLPRPGESAWIVRTCPGHQEALGSIVEVLTEPYNGADIHCAKCEARAPAPLVDIKTDAAWGNDFRDLNWPHRWLRRIPGATELALDENREKIEHHEEMLKHALKLERAAFQRDLFSFTIEGFT